MVTITIEKTMESRTKIIPLAMIVITGFLLVSQLQQFANASSNSPYDSGRDHGCDDAGISDIGDRYINQPEKGPSFHTNEFMRGYNDGYDECSGSGSGSGESLENLGSELCNLVDSNRGAATLLALALGYPGLDQAALALCGVTVMAN
jgi:hypothetical protein